MNSNELVTSLIREFADKENERASWDVHWDEIAKYTFSPLVGRFVSKGEQKFNPGAKQGIFSSVPAIAAVRHAALMDYISTPRNSRWHRLVPVYAELKKDKRVSNYFQDLTDTLFRFRYSPRANFAAQNYEGWVSQTLFGNECLLTDSLDSRIEFGVRYKSIPLHEVYPSQNHHGVVDKIFRRFKLSARQARQQFGEGRLPDTVKRELKEHPEREFAFLHVVAPREDYDPERKDAKGMPFGSYYIFIQDRVLIKEGGYRTFPYQYGRYQTVPGEVYAIGPATIALPAIRMINDEKKIVIKQGHRTVAPVLLTHDDGIISTFSVRPDAINAGAVTADGKPLVHALPTGDIAVGDKLIEMETLEIKDAFLLSVLQIFIETPQMTATEVLERAREKAALLAPMMGRQHTEKLGPMIQRELDCLDAQGQLPEMPPALVEAGGEFKIEYDSPLNRAQRADEAAGLARAMETMVAHFNLTQGSQEAVDWIDVDEAIPDLMDIHAVPSRWIASEEKVASKREGREKLAQQAQMTQAGPSAAALIKAQAIAQKESRK